MKSLINPRWMWLKAFLFLAIGIIAFGLLLIENWSWRLLGLLCLTIWAFCRAYYFAFYVIEKYIDPRFKFSGFLNFLHWCMRQSRLDQVVSNSGFNDDSAKNTSGVNLIVIRSANIDRAVSFYEGLGLAFKKHRHGKGPEHHSAEMGGLVFEIYPITLKSAASTGTRLGFAVESVDLTVSILLRLGAECSSLPADSPWGRRAVMRDFDGHVVELISYDEQVAIVTNFILS